MPHMPDIQRKRTLAEWVVKTKKQVVKLYAVVKWSRDAAVVQKAMVRYALGCNIGYIAQSIIECHRLSHGSEPAIR
jgi:hypothetical protein